MHPGGFLEVITGPMFAGKTTELIKRIERQMFAKRKAALFKPAIDNRYSEDEIVAHNGLRYEAFVIPADEEGVRKIEEITKRENFEVIGIDEVQFFPMIIVETLNRLADDGVYVIASGLNLDFKGDPFPVTRELLVRADNIVYLTAVCTVCGRPATRSQRLIDGKPAPRDSPVILVGGRESYEARCRLHHEVP
ncbi:thymidine kinase [Thermococcus sp. GR7]|uniref:thymidine kinase n=1 Tax=unclassified Thermococcus TaxID=2627626 RepID=UPI00142FC1D5|nr:MULTISPECIES: thymidine kinase [unclassified Thermococcus]NJE46925.1 thymidine kinase [Thermococcus sp. GR7]NJE78422.1 thymidine kinase [Thermococcus sp. GR4]NJF23281.1 thymidine kinase [Thermococcus sp. GR5]